MILRLGAGLISLINLGELSLTESRQQTKNMFLPCNESAFTEAAPGTSSYWSDAWR